MENNNGSCKVAWHKEFTNQGFNNPNEVIKIKNALLRMQIVKFNKKENTYSWNKQKTLPNPNLVDGIYKTIKETKEETQVKVTITVTPPQIYLNGILLPSNITSITR